MRSTFSRLPHPKEAYFLRTGEVRKDHYVSPARTLFVSENKDEVFDRLRAAEAQGIACWVENLKGEKIS